MQVEAPHQVFRKSCREGSTQPDACTGAVTCLLFLDLSGKEIHMQDNTHFNKRWAVLVMDMFHYHDPDAEIEVGGFTTQRQAVEYAIRRTRDGIEHLRRECVTHEELQEKWWRFGECCAVIGGNYDSEADVPEFVRHPATTEQRDWLSLTPEYTHRPPVTEVVHQPQYQGRNGATP
jgi:hypothetical protein